MNPFEVGPIGKTALHVTRLGMGGGTLGDLWETIPEAQADATLAAAWEGGIRFFDTAPFYGHTKSEHRIGRSLRTRPRDEYVLTTKVGRVYHRPESPEAYRPGGWSGGLPFNFRVDYTRSGVLRSYEDSLMRLGLNRVDALLVHDLDPGALGSEEAAEARLTELEREGGFEALRELRATGEIRAVGVGINRVGMVPLFLERFDPDFFLIAMPYTLLNQEALEVELPLCQDRGVGVVIGAPFASGLLAGPQGPGTYGYRPAPPEMVEKTRSITAVCVRHGVPLGAAALQFPLGHPAVAAVIPGPNSPEQARQNVDWMRTDIPGAFWLELRAERLVRLEAPLPP